SAAASPTEGADVLAAPAGTLDAGTLSAAEGADALSAGAGVTSSGTIAATETGDLLTAAGSTTGAATLAVTEGADAAGFAGPPAGAADASIQVEWSSPAPRGPKAPSGFHVSSGTGGEPDYSTPVATVLYSAGFLGQFQTILTDLTDGTAYTIGVRAYNATAEE